VKYDGLLETIDASTGSLRQTFATEANFIHSIAFSADGKTLVSAGENFINNGQTNTILTGYVELWTVSSGSLQQSLNMGDERCNAVALSADGQCLAVGWNSPSGPGAMEVFNLPPGMPPSEAFAFNETNVHALCFSSDSQVLFLGSDTDFQAIGMMHGNVLEDVPSVTYRSGSPSALGISPDGTQLAFGTANGVFGVLGVPPFNTGGLKSVAVSASNIVGGNSTTGTVTLGLAAPAGGLVVNLGSNNVSATVPGSVTVPAGKTSATFPISSLSVSTATPVAIWAAVRGYTVATTLTVFPHVLATFTVTPSTVSGGVTSRGKVTLVSAAPAGGLVIKFISSAQSAVPPVLNVVPAGGTEADFNISTVASTPTVDAIITAQSGFDSISATLRVLGLVPVSFQISPSTVVGGVTARGYVTLSGQAPSGGQVVKFSSNSSSVVPPAQNTVPAGGNTASFNVSTLAVTSVTSATVTVSCNGGSVSATLRVLP
jgi:hypothetical protein